MRAIIYIPDIECDSCTKVISKRLQNKEGVHNYELKQDHLIINYDESKIKVQDIIQLIKEAGFRASLNPFERKALKERWKDFNQNQHKYEIEIKGIQYALAIFFVLTFIEVIGYLTNFKNIPNFIQIYGMWLFYLNLSISSLGFALWHFFSYKTKITCMTGMMIGMTFGMQTGMMLGAIIGATNGFFIGAMTGMFLGVSVGIITGKCCGIMGIMEGMMAGLMGGTMGPMITLMMLSDNLVWFMPFYIIVNMIILLGLSYMLYEEVVENRTDIRRQPVSFSVFALLSVFTVLVLIYIMLYAPKSAAIVQ